MQTARVFARRTKASPVDALAFYDEPPMFGIEGVTEVHVSCTFTADMPRAEWLARSWSRIAPAKIGGPGAGDRGEEFTPGMYLKPGYVITSRGCPNHCWFCEVPKREGELRELPITEGWNVLDDNLLACSDSHIRGVFAMLRAQKHPVEFTGGLEAARLLPWHVEELSRLRLSQMFFAYDTPDDYEPLREAGKLLTEAGFTVANRKARAYVLIGHPKDEIHHAERRLWQTIDAGFMPHAMLYQDKAGTVRQDWKRFQRSWARPAAIAMMMKAEEAR